MKICEILRKEKIVIDIPVEDKETVINKMIDLFKDDERIENLDLVRKSVLDREKIMSTGVGKGFAIPHAKTDGVNEIVAGFARTSAPIDFNSMDNEPVNLIFLLVGKENQVGPHIKLLSRISRMMNSDEFRDSLLSASNVDEVFEIFENEEKKYC